MTFTVGNVLLAILFGACVCLGWSAMADVWKWLTSQGVSAPLVGLIVLVVVLILLVVL